MSEGSTLGAIIIGLNGGVTLSVFMLAAAQGYEEHQDNRINSRVIADAFNDGALSLNVASEMDICLRGGKTSDRHFSRFPSEGCIEYRPREARNGLDILIEASEYGAIYRADSGIICLWDRKSVNPDIPYRLYTACASYGSGARDFNQNTDTRSRRNPRPN